MRQLLTGLLFIVTLCVNGQNGYLVTLEGDSIYGEISISQGVYYDEVKVKYDKGKEIYKAFRLKTVVKNGEVFETVNYNNRKTLGKLLTKGTLSLYAVRPKDQSQYTERIFYKDGNALQLSSIGFRGSAADFLADCEFVALKLKGRELSYTDIDEVITIYNSKCGTAEETPVIVTDNKQLISFSQLLFDITSKLENGEEVPTYMIEALEKYSDVSIDSKVQELLKTLKEN